MTQEMITLNNKLIAQFMGWKDVRHETISPSIETNHANTYMRFDSPDGKISLSYYHDDFTTSLPFHTSWDWLMPVVDKIEGFNTEINGEEIIYFEFKISRNHCAIFGYTSNRGQRIYYQTAYGTNPDNKMSAIYDAIISFLTSHNQQTPQQ